MKFTLARAHRPRNPVVAPALVRQANHRHQAAAERQRASARAVEIRPSLQSGEEASTATPTPTDPHSP